MGKLFDILNRINHVLIAKTDKFSPDSGLNAKVKVGETISVNLNGVNING